MKDGDMKPLIVGDGHIQPVAGEIGRSGVRFLKALRTGWRTKINSQLNHQDLEHHCNCYQTNPYNVGIAIINHPSLMVSTTHLKD